MLIIGLRYICFLMPRMGFVWSTGVFQRDVSCRKGECQVKNMVFGDIFYPEFQAD